VNDGWEAVETCRNQPEIELVLMDIKMPEMDGYEATRQIRQFNKKVVIIAQTAHTLVYDKIMALKSGCNDYISKPIDKDLLNALINKHFMKKEN
jgi:CheY-like chemotaxis protein